MYLKSNKRISYAEINYTKDHLKVLAPNVISRDNEALLKGFFVSYQYSKEEKPNLGL